MYELIILSLLMWQPMHGYLIAKIIDDTIGPFAKVSHGRLYPLLAALQRDGLIAPVEGAGQVRGGRHQREFAITETGRERFRQLMLDTTSNPGEYRTFFWLKVPYLSMLMPEEQHFLLEHYETYCQAHIFHGTHELDDIRQDVARGYISPRQYEGIARTLRHFVRVWQIELEDTRECGRDLLVTQSSMDALSEDSEDKVAESLE